MGPHARIGKERKNIQSGHVSPPAEPDVQQSRNEHTFEQKNLDCTMDLDRARLSNKLTFIARKATVTLVPPRPKRVYYNKSDVQKGCGFLVLTF